MRISAIFSVSKILVLLCLIVSVTCGCKALLARTPQVSQAAESKEKFTGRGIRIIQVDDSSPADRAGLKPMDLIFRYGDYEVVDDATYFAARDAYEHGHGREIPILIWREGKALKLMVSPGRLGIKSNEYSPVAYQFSSLMMGLDVQEQVPEYQRDREFKGSYLPPEKIIEQAKAVIDQAEREGTLTPTQILVARIYMILDDAPPEELKRQSEMLAQLISTQPVSYVGTLAQLHFFDNRHYRPAIECFKRQLAAHPDDFASRLNMGFAYYHLGMFTEGEAAADYVLAHHDDELDEYDHLVAYQIKAMGTLNRGDYDSTISLSEKAFDIEPSGFDISRVMLAAAQTGNVDKVAEASQKLMKALPKDFEKKKLNLTAVEALALVKSNQSGRARELVQSLKDTDRVEGRLKAYWAIYPGGVDVWTNWKNLTKD